MTEEERAALDLFLAFETQHHDHFSAQLFRLFQKADASNRRKLSQGFPVHGAIHQEWTESPTVQEFYDRYQVRANYVPDGDVPDLNYAVPKYPADPIPHDVRDIMHGIGSAIADVINDQMDRPMCFLLMVFDVGENGTNSYISNAERQDVLKMLEEFIEKHRDDPH